MENQTNLFKAFGFDEEVLMPMLAKQGRGEKKPPKAKCSAEFGEHIGGARKELWRRRNLSCADLPAMNGAERTKYVRKEHVWKRPDYGRMIAEGLPPIVAYSVKKIRDALPAGPLIRHGDATEEARLARQQEYIAFCGAMRDMAMSLASTEDLTLIRDSFLYGQGWVTRRSGRLSFIPADKSHGLMDNKLFRALDITDQTLFSYAEEMRKSQFGVPKEEKIPAGYSVSRYGGDSYPRREGWADGTWYVTRRHLAIAANIPTREEAVEKARDAAAAARKGGRTAFLPEQLGHIIRSGLPDVRKGRHITGQDFLSDFKIRGGEFGNWMNEKDAQASLDMAYEAFHDFAAALGIPPSGVSLGGRLSIAFGARGIGKAAAHYEPAREVINLTKMKGAGSLGHELFHAMDGIFGKRLGFGGFLTEQAGAGKDVPLSVRNVMDAILRRPLGTEERAAYIAEKTEGAWRRLEGWVNYCLPDATLDGGQRELKKAILKDMRERTGVIAVRAEDVPEIGRLSDLKKEATGRIIRKKEREALLRRRLNYARAQEMRKNGLPLYEPSGYYAASRKMDALHSREPFGYWHSRPEMFARAGACFLTDALSAKGGRSDYLSGHSELCVGIRPGKDGQAEILKAYPEGEERERINRAIREMLADFRERGLFLTPQEKEEFRRDTAFAVLESGKKLKLHFSTDTPLPSSADGAISYTIYNADGTEDDGGEIGYPGKGRPIMRDVAELIPAVLSFHYGWTEGGGQGYMLAAEEETSLTE